MWKPSVIPLLRVNLHMATISCDQEARVRYLSFPPDKERTSNLLLAILDKFGVHKDGIGDSTDMLAI